MLSTKPTTSQNLDKIPVSADMRDVINTGKSNFRPLWAISMTFWWLASHSMNFTTAELTVSGSTSVPFTVNLLDVDTTIPLICWASVDWGNLST